MSPLLSPASLMACSNGVLQRSSRSAVSSWNLARRQALVEMERTFVGGGDERQVDLGLLHLAELDLGLLGSLLEALHGHVVLAQVDVVGRLELGDEPVDDPLIPVVATQAGVAVGRLDLEHPVADLEDRDVEGASAEVEHEDGLVLAFLVESVGKRRGGRLVDDAEHLEACDLAGLLGGGALRVVEVRGDRDDGLGDRVAEVGLGVTLQLLERAGRDLLAVVVLAVDADRPVGADVALHRPDRAIGVGDGLALGDLADQDLAVLGEGHDRWGRARTLGVGDDNGIAGLEHADDRVGGTEIDSDGLGHC